MNCSIPQLGLVALVLLSAPSGPGIARAEKTLVYDEERGIILVDKEEYRKRKREKTRPVTEPKPAAPEAQPPRRSSSKFGDIHAGRRKDPPREYFTSGLKYFRNGDYRNALKNFTYADSVDPDPRYALWVGKSLRRLGKHERMLFVMQKILNTYPESEVADDALFEVAFHHQKRNNYEKAIEFYTRLAEQYPFGRSFSSGEEFREVARTQRQLMRAEMTSTLKILGYKGDGLSDLYTAFQRDHELPTTGRGDSATVSAIKQRHRRHVAEEQRHASQREQMRRHFFWIMAGAIVLLGNLVSMIVLHFMLRGRLKQLETMSELLAELRFEAQ